MAYIKGHARDQALLLPASVKGYVAADSPVRFIDAFVDDLDLGEAGFHRSRPKAAGRPGYDPGDMLKLYLYGYFNRVRSSRRLEAEARRLIVHINERLVSGCVRCDQSVVLCVAASDTEIGRTFSQPRSPGRQRPSSSVTHEAASRNLPMVRVAALLIWIAAALGVPAVAAPVSTIVAEHGRLHVRDARVVDAHGLPVTLRGMSLFWSQWRPQFYNPRAIRWIASDWHATAVRAAVAAANGGYATEPAVETRRAEEAIDAAIKAGIYVVVDWHAHDPMPDEAIRFFTTIAHRYRGVPNLIYETWNEPLPKYGWSAVIKPYHLRVIAAIRAQDPGAFVVAGTRSWDQDVDEAAADPIGLPDVAYALHFYAATHRQNIRNKADWALSRGAALFVTEYGTTAANGDSPIDAVETKRWWDWCDAHGISYLNWSLSDKAEASAALRPGASSKGGWSHDQLTVSGALVRDHLRAAPVVPSSPAGE